MPVRVVLDTNVLVSALLFQAGAFSWLRSAWRSGNLIPLVSRETTAELMRVLAYPKFALGVDDQQDLLDDYLPFCETVSVTGAFDIPNCRDPFDRPFLELAIAGNADALVTGDSDILILADDFRIPVLTPAAFRQSRFLKEV